LWADWAENLAPALLVVGERDEKYRAEPYPTFMMDLIDAGGLIPYLLKEGFYE